MKIKNKVLFISSLVLFASGLFGLILSIAWGVDGIFYVISIMGIVMGVALFVL